MTDRPDRDSPVEDIVKWSWAKLRRVKLKEQDRAEVERLHNEAESANRITVRNHFGDGIRQAMQIYPEGT